ncbi:unnamed protein product [Aphis gossypii]|uniref:Uncharacterized protein n=1 Tax=Aphis gossypii TaxID=80765 RepID=A0A9P0NJZ5_APHGO|nr:unnamed protein product [Aphis gossypii]
MGDDLKNKHDSLIHKDQDTSSERLGKIKDQQEADSFMKKKKKLWLQAEKKRKKREEEENKFKLSIQAKQKKKEELKKIMEEKIKMKLKRNQILEEQRKQKIENEKEEIAKAKLIAKKKKLEENEKEAEKLRRLEAIKQEAKRIEEEEEAWRKQINNEFAQKMGYPMNLNIVKKKNEYSLCNNGKKKLTRYTDKLLKEIKQNNEVFDSGNLMKQIIERELNKIEKKKVKYKFFSIKLFIY